MSSKVILGAIISVAFLTGAIMTVPLVRADPVNPVQKIIDMINALQDDIANISEPLTQIETRGFENDQNFVRSFEITSTGPMIVDVCGELNSSDAFIGDSARIDVRNIDAGLNSVRLSSNDRTDELVTDCLTIGAAADQPIRITYSATLAGDPSLSGYFTARTTPSAVLTIVET